MTILAWMQVSGMLEVIFPLSQTQPSPAPSSVGATRAPGREGDMEGGTGGGRGEGKCISFEASAPLLPENKRQATAMPPSALALRRVGARGGDGEGARARVR